MNLENLAAFRGEIWARRLLRRLSSARSSVANRPWPGQIDEARKLAASLGKPRLVNALAAIIQERASVAWKRGLDS